MKPTNMGTGRVTGQFAMGVTDGPDLDNEPEIIPLAGTVTFTPSVPYLPNRTAEPNPITIVTAPIKAVLDNEGYLCTPDVDGVTPQYRGIRLFATDDEDTSVKNWTYSVTYRFSVVNGVTPSIKAHSISLPEGTEVDLTKSVDVPSSPGIGTPQALALLAEAEAAATASADAANIALQVKADADAGLFRGEPGPAGPNTIPTDEFNAELIQDPASATATALTAAFVPPTGDGKDKLKAADSDKLRPFYSALASRATDPLDVIVVGDSISEGEGATTVANRWISRFLASLRAQFQPKGITGGRGYVPAWYAFASPSPSTAGFAPSGSGVTQATIYGLGRRSATLASGGTLTITVTCSSFDVVYPQQAAGGVFSVTVDGGTPVNVDTTAAGNLGGRKQRFTPAQRGSHTVVIAHVSGTPTIEGIMVYDGDETAGIRLWDGSHYGYTSNGFASIGTWSEGMLAFTADLAVVALGTNDYGTNVAPATFKANLQAIITTLRGKAPGVTIVVLGMYQRSGTFTYAWADYLSAMRDVVTADSNAIMVDLTRRLPNGSTADPLGFITADGVHPTSTGHQIMADFVSGTVLDGVRGGVALDGITDPNGNVILANTKSLTLQRKDGIGAQGRIFVNTANQMDIQLAGGSLRIANNAYDAILWEISNSGTITIGGGPTWRKGSGSPEGVITAQRGSMYMRNDASDGQPGLYIKETGTGNTGWVAK